MLLVHNPDTVNSFFAKVASKADYNPRELDQFVCGDDGSYTPINNVQVEALLRNIKSTASGCDNLPAWLLCNCSYDIVTYMLHCSLSTGHVPSY